MSFTAQGKQDQAVARMNKEIETNPDNALAPNLLGELYVTKKNYTEAEAFSKRQ